MLSSVPFLQDDEEDALYDIDTIKYIIKSMFTNIWIDEIMNSITEPPIFLKVIKLLIFIGKSFYKMYF